jgi:PIN domain nuclease of toxin-antitoxin system
VYQGRQTPRWNAGNNLTQENLFPQAILKRDARRCGALAAGGRLELTISAGDWIAASEALPSIRFVPVSNSIALKSVQLPGDLHNDPADRIIIATAVSMGAILITKDEKIRTYPHVKTAW